MTTIGTMLAACGGQAYRALDPSHMDTTVRPQDDFYHGLV